MSAALIGQESTFGPCCLPVKWDSIEFNPEGTPDREQSILIVTNRPFNPEDPDNVIFPNAISDFRKVTYLFATCNQGEWVLSPVSDLFSGLQVIDEGKDILLFVHGHGKSLPQVLTRAHQIRKKYGVALVVFDWPSYNSNFNKTNRTASREYNKSHHM